MAESPSRNEVVDFAGYVFKRGRSIQPGSSPRPRDELAKLGLYASTATIRKYRPKSRHPPAQSGLTFLRNRAGAIVAMDFFVVPAVTFCLLCVTEEPEWMQVSFAIALHIGCRLRETRISSRCVNLKENKITFPSLKGVEEGAFSIPMPTALKPVFEKMKAERRRYTVEFPFQPGVEQNDDLFHDHAAWAASRSQARITSEACTAK